MKRQSKKILTIILTMVLLCTSLFTIGVSAQGEKSLSLGLVSGKTIYKTGDTFVLTVNASQFQGIVNGICGFTMNLGYDSTKFDFVAGSETLLKDTTTGSLSVETQENNLTILFYDDALALPLGFMTAGNLISLSFKVIANTIPSDYNFTLFTYSSPTMDFVDNDETTLITVAYPAALAVTTVVYGDANGNGIVGLSDLVIVRDYLLETVTLTEANKIAADLYNEGNITLNSLVGLMDIVSQP